MTVKVDGERTRAGLRNLAAGIVQAANQALAQGVRAAEAKAKGTDRFHDRSGETRASIRGEVFGARGFVRAGGASGLLENGTAPHMIYARGGALRFEVNGQVLFRRMVHHPGTSARPFMAEAAAEGSKVADYAADYFLSEAIRRVRA